MDTSQRALVQLAPRLHTDSDADNVATAAAAVEFEAEVASVADRISQLRASGLTPKQIREELPGVSPWAINCAINRDAKAQASHPGLRARARDADREHARALRLEGKTYKQIQAAIGVSSSTLSLWLRDLPHPQPDRAAHARRMTEVVKERRSAQRSMQRAAAFASVGGISGRELMLIGVALYWAEGTKDKAYSRRESIQFINSGAGMVKVFLRWLDLVGVDETRRQYRLSIHESADIAAAQTYWRSVIGVPGADFRSATLKRHNPKTVRKRTGGDYHGCLVIQVRCSSTLYRLVDGWWHGILEAGGVTGMPD